jgi:two-component system OmpR family sensor kinase
VPIRLRLGLSFALVTLVLVTAGGLIFALSFRTGLERSLEPGLRAQFRSLAESARRGLGSDPTSGDVVLVGGDDLVTQILGRNGEVLVSTREAGSTHVVPDAIARVAASGFVFTSVTIGREREPYRVLAGPIRSDTDMRVGIVGTSLEATNTAVSRVHVGLVVGGAAAVLVAGFGGWLLAVAALRPVERMRRSASEISEHDATTRLPVPTTRDEIAALASTVNALLDRLQGSLARQRAFVADASHELRTPLAVLCAELELAVRQERSPDELRDAIAHATQEVERLARLVDDLLFLARSDERAQLLTEDTPIVPLLEAAIGEARAQAAAGDVRLQIDAKPELRASVAPTLVHQAVVNLVANAIRHSPMGATVVVRARRDHDAVEIEVLDEGPGFPTAFLPDAFERFRRADASRSRRDGGTGLGLAIVRAIASAHGGTAEAATRPTGGAVVKLRIPSPV